MYLWCALAQQRVLGCQVMKMGIHSPSLPQICSVTLNRSPHLCILPVTPQHEELPVTSSKGCCEVKYIKEQRPLRLWYQRVYKWTAALNLLLLLLSAQCCEKCKYKDSLHAQELLHKSTMTCTDSKSWENQTVSTAEKEFLLRDPSRKIQVRFFFSKNANFRLPCGFLHYGHN